MSYFVAFVSLVGLATAYYRSSRQSQGPALVSLSHALLSLLLFFHGLSSQRDSDISAFVTVFVFQTAILTFGNRFRHALWSGSVFLVATAFLSPRTLHTILLASGALIQMVLITGLYITCSIFE